MILKIQFPLNAVIDDPIALIYNEDKSVETFMSVASVEQALTAIGCDHFANEAKLFVDADVDGSDVVIKDIVSPCEW